MDYDPIESRLIKTETRTAREERVCDDCNEPIHRGERYYRHVGIVDGDFRSHVSHSPNGECAI